MVNKPTIIYIPIFCVVDNTPFYTRSVWDLGLSVRQIFFMARRNHAQ